MKQNTMYLPSSTVPTRPNLMASVFSSENQLKRRTYRARDSSAHNLTYQHHRQADANWKINTIFANAAILCLSLPITPAGIVLYHHPVSRIRARKYKLNNREFWSNMVTFYQRHCPASTIWLHLYGEEIPKSGKNLSNHIWILAVSIENSEITWNF